MSTYSIYDLNHQIWLPISGGFLIYGLLTSRVYKCRFQQSLYEDQVASGFAVSSESLGILRIFFGLYCLRVGFHQLFDYELWPLDYYTVWNWWLLTAYFLLGGFYSLRNHLAGDKQGRIVRQSTQNYGISLTSKQYQPTVQKQDQNRRLAGPLGSFISTLMHINLTTCIIIDAITWLHLVPQAHKLEDPVQQEFHFSVYYSYYSYRQHIFNIVLLSIETFLNGMPAEMHRMSYLMVWGISYLMTVIFSYLMNGFAHNDNIWPYEFLDARVSVAPKVYGGLMTAHILAFGLAYFFLWFRSSLMQLAVAAWSNNLRIRFSVPFLFSAKWGPEQTPIKSN